MTATANRSSTTQDDGIGQQSHGLFFGRRNGHKLRAHQADLIAHLLPHLSLDPANPAPEDVADLFAPGVQDVRLEIGFGGGEHLAAEAQSFSATGFIGCEPYVNGMAKILSQIEAHNIGNIRLFAGDAAELLAWLSPGSLSRIDLIHPDPWPKRRHWKRRLVQDATIRQFARILRRGGEFHFATDVADYAAWTLQRFMRCADFEWTAQRADDWRKPWPDFTGTRYQAKAARAERAQCFLIFRRC